MKFKYLRNKIIRPKGSTTLAIHVKSIEYSHFGKYALSVRYFAIGETTGMGEKDMLLLSDQDLMDGYEALVNPTSIRKFSDAKWKSLKFLADYADKKSKEKR